MAGKRAKAVVLELEPASPAERLLSIPEVMEMLGLSRPMVYKLIHEEGLPTVVFGNRRKVVPSSLATWVKQREQSDIKRTGSSEPAN
jgi:excisionase family DNA binding protein